MQRSGATPPFAPSNRLIGNIREAGRDPMGSLMATSRLGDVVRYRLAWLDFYLVSHPDGVQRVLVDNNRNYTRSGSPAWNALKPAFGDALAVSDGESWFYRRRIMQPVFTPNHVGEFAETMIEEASRMLDGWTSDGGQPRSVDVAAAVSRMTLEMLRACLFGVRTPAQIRELGEATWIQSEDAILRSRLLVYPPPWVPTPHNLRLRAAMRTLDRSIYALIADHRSNPPARADLLALLMQARDPDSGDGLTDRQLRDEVALLYFVGFASAAGLLHWAFYLLARHPGVERRLVDEVDGVLGGRTPTVADLHELPVLQMILSETLRLYPPIWLSVRRIVADDEIVGYRVPAGSHVAISPHVMHRDPRFWDDPERFDPDRFSPERSTGRPRYAYFPFLGGPHQCLGRDFALLHAQLVLVLALQRYRLELAPDHVAEAQPLITQRMRGNLPMSVSPR
jgi:cytochrome P450